MDSLISAAARALAAGDPLSALKRVALRDDAAALALRGIAMAQLGDLERAKGLLKEAARAFGPKEAVARARCVVAEAEIALVTRDLRPSSKPLEDARTTLETHGDKLNAAHARHLEVRRLVLIGRLDDAERLLAGLDPAPFPPASRAAHELVVAGIAVRRIKTKPARVALARAREAARRSGVAALAAEVDAASFALTAPAARLIAGREERPLSLAAVEDLFDSDVLVIDACRYAVRRRKETAALATRPVLFAIARALAEAWPEDASRETLVKRAFRAKEADDSHRARLRVEIGRLRRALKPFAGVSATPDGFVLSPRGRSRIVVLAPPVDDEHAAALACLADGEAWSSSALAVALGASQRTVQRMLEALAAAGKAQSFGRGRARRWIAAPPPGFTTVLLLPGPPPGG